MDNLCYVLGVNAVGENACGKSRVVAPWGTIIAEAPSDQEEILLAEIDFTKVDQARKEIPYYRDYPLVFAPALGLTKEGNGV